MLQMCVEGLLWRQTLKASAAQIHELALSRRLVLSYVPEAEEALRRLGGNFVQLLNVLREGKAEEIATGLRFEGRLENGTVIAISGRPFKEVCEKPKEVRTGLFVWDICRGEERQGNPKRSA